MTFHLDSHVVLWGANSADIAQLPTPPSNQDDFDDLLSLDSENSRRRSKKKSFPKKTATTTTPAFVTPNSVPGSHIAALMFLREAANQGSSILQELEQTYSKTIQSPWCLPFAPTSLVSRARMMECSDTPFKVLVDKGQYVAAVSLLMQDLSNNLIRHGAMNSVSPFPHIIHITRCHKGVQSRALDLCISAWRLGEKAVFVGDSASTLRIAEMVWRSFSLVSLTTWLCRFCR